MEYNFFGPSQIAAVAAQDRQAFFGPEIEEKAEAVIAKYQPLVDAVIAKYKPRLKGKTVMLYVGGLRPAPRHHRLRGSRHGDRRHGLRVRP